MARTMKKRGGTKHSRANNTVITTPIPLGNVHTKQMNLAFKSQEAFAKEQLKMKRKNDIKRRIEKICVDVAELHKAISDTETKSKKEGRLTFRFKTGNTVAFKQSLVAYMMMGVENLDSIKREFCDVEPTIEEHMYADFEYGLDLQEGFILEFNIMNKLFTMAFDNCTKNNFLTLLHAAVTKLYAKHNERRHFFIRSLQKQIEAAYLEHHTGKNSPNRSSSRTSRRHSF